MGSDSGALGWRLHQAYLGKRNADHLLVPCMRATWSRAELLLPPRRPPKNPGLGIPINPNRRRVAVRLQSSQKRN